MQPAVSIPGKIEGLQPVVSIAKEKIGKKEGLQPAESISEKEEGLQPAGSIPKEKDRHEGLEARGFNRKRKRQTRRKTCCPLFLS